MVRFDRFVLSNESPADYVAGVVKSDILSPEMKVIFAELYNQKHFKVKIMKSVDAFSELRHVVISFRRIVNAAKFGNLCEFPESIHAVFVGTEYRTGFAFPPLYQNQAETKRNEIVDNIRIVIMQVETCDKINIFGTLSTGALMSYWQDPPRRGIDPVVPYIEQAANLLTDDEVAPGLWNFYKGLSDAPKMTKIEDL